MTADEFLDELPPVPENALEPISSPSNSLRFNARATGYFPVNPGHPAYQMEGGRVGAGEWHGQEVAQEPLFTLEDYMEGKAPYVSVAMDNSQNNPLTYGTLLRSSKFPGVPFRVMDTGSAFNGRTRKYGPAKGLSRIDIARRDARGANSPENNTTLDFEVWDRQSAPVEPKAAQGDTSLSADAFLDEPAKAPAKNVGLPLEDGPAKSADSFLDAPDEFANAPVAKPTAAGLAHWQGIYNEGLKAQQGALQAAEIASLPGRLDWSEVNNARDEETFRAAEGLRAQAWLIENGQAQGDPFTLRREADSLLSTINPNTRIGQYLNQQGEAQLAAIEQQQEEIPPFAVPLGAMAQGVRENAPAGVGGLLGASMFTPWGLIPALAAGYIGSRAGAETQAQLSTIGETPLDTQLRVEESARTQEANPTAYAIGRNLAMAPFFRPSMTEMARALEGNPAALRNMGTAGVIGAGMSAGSDVLQGRNPDPGRAIAAGLENAIMNKPTRLGRALGFQPSESQVTTKGDQTPSATPSKAGQTEAQPETAEQPAGQGRASGTSADDFLDGIEGNVLATEKNQEAVAASGIGGSGKFFVNDIKEGGLTSSQITDVANKMGYRYSGSSSTGDKTVHNFVDMESVPGARIRFSIEGPVTPERLAARKAENSQSLDSAESRILGAEKTEQGQMGSGGGNVVPRFTAKDIVVSPADLRSGDANVEKRWRAAKIDREGFFSRVKRKAAEVKNAFTRPAYAQDLDPKTDGRFIEWMAQYQQVPGAARQRAFNLLQGLTNKLGPNAFNVYNRVIILRDLAKDVERGLHDGKGLPFGYTPDTLKADLEKFERIGNSHPDVAQALENRKGLIVGMRNALVERGLLPEDVTEFDDYFRRQVLTYYNAKQEAAGIPQNVTDKTYGFQKARTGSAKDFNTEYLEAEGEYLSQAYAKLRVHDMLKQAKEWADITPGLKETAEAQGVKDWESLIPADYTKWQPKPGKLFYWTHTLPEKVVDEIFALRADGETGRTVGPEDIGESLAMGGDRETWIIPKRLAKTFDSMTPRKDSLPEKVAMKANSAWKRWTLHAPQRTITYNLNNLSGDVDAILAYQPKILSYIPGAMKALKGTASGKKPLPPEVLEATEKGVLQTGMTAQEFKDIAQDDAFAMLTGKKPNLIARYFKSTEQFAQWRESVTRLAAYRYFKDQVRSGKNPLAASNRKILADIPNPDDRAARLARELMGDYGSTSPVGKWLAEKLIPFWRFQGINLERYLNLVRNLPFEGGSAGRGLRVPVVVAGRGVKLAAKASLLGYGMLYAWNHLLFPQEEAELSDAERRQLHMILGRNADGTIQTLRVQGSLSDLLGWVGLQDYPEDIRKIIEGKKEGSDMVEEAGEAMLSKVVNAAMPIPKAALEAGLGKSFFPNPTEPRPLRDGAEHVASTFSLRWLYDKLNDIPMPKSKREDMTALFTYTTDPGEAAYMTVREMTFDWLEKQGRDRQGGEPTERSNALYYYRQSLRYQDAKLAEKWKKRYFDLGGTEKGISQSVSRTEPLGAIGKKDRTAFLQSLSAKDQEILKRADEWFSRVYGQ